jgi:hypothetical protein
MAVKHRIEASISMNGHDSKGAVAPLAVSAARLLPPVVRDGDAQPFLLPPALTDMGNLARE